MRIDFDGKTIIVTGGGHGLGREMCRAFSSLGGQVWTCDLSKEKLTETEALAGPGCRGRVVDVRDRAGVSSFLAEATEVSGAVDILVNNAGGVVGQVGRPLEEVSVGTDHQHLIRGRVAGEPNGDSGVRFGQGRSDRPDQATGARAGSIRHHRQLRGSGFRPVQSYHRTSVGVVR